MKTLVLLAVMMFTTASFSQFFSYSNYFETTNSYNSGYDKQDNSHYNDNYVRPISNRKLNYAIRSIKRKTFSDTQLRLAKQIVSSNYLTVSQLARVANVFSFESTKLEFAKFAYDYAYDPENYWLINEIFTFSSSTDELDAFLYGQY